MKEVWKPVVGYEGRYEVSNCGRVKSFRFKKWRVLDLHVSKRGYRRVGLHSNGRRKTTGVHRLVLQSFTGECPSGCEGSHLDGDKLNNNISNLVWESHQDNVSRITSRTPAVGESHGKSKLTKNIVIKMREMWESKSHNQYEIADSFGVKQSCVWAAVNKITWKHI